MDEKYFIGRLIYRLFLLSWFFAILWVKGYLWWLLAIAVLLFVGSVLVSTPFSVRAVDESKPEMPAAKRRRWTTKMSEDDDDTWREPKPSQPTPRTKRS